MANHSLFEEESKKGIDATKPPPNGSRLHPTVLLPFHKTLKTPPGDFLKAGFPLFANELQEEPDRSKIRLQSFWAPILPVLMREVGRHLFPTWKTTAPKPLQKPLQILSIGSRIDSVRGPKAEWLMKNDIGLFIWTVNTPVGEL